ncbi:MAG: DNA polymerase IV [Thaumarchaeota archaeon]|nr:DNA polymerase IV [Nitrososphaerota archaeon]
MSDVGPNFDAVTKSSSHRVIFHVDIDSFYPSVEMRENPKLVGKAVIVGADPKEGRGRGVVVSSSYEARKLGIHSGMPISRAYRIAKDAVYLRPNFSLYSNVSRRIMNLLRTFADSFEQVSIDEAFLDVTEKVLGSYEDARSYAIMIKTRIEAEERLTCSIGIAPNKSCAKIASDYEKPDGLVVVTPEEVKSFLAPLPARAISGIGSKTEAFLQSIGVNTIGDLQKVPGKDLVKYFGKTGVWLWGVANGVEQIEVREKPMRSLGAEHTFEKDTEEKAELLLKLEELIDRLHGRVVSAGVRFRVVGVRIRFAHFQTFSREHTLANFTSEKQVILSEARNLLKEFEKKQDKVRLIGVYVSDLREDEFQERGSKESLESWFSNKQERSSATI